MDWVHFFLRITCLLDVTLCIFCRIKPVFNEGARVYTPELCHDFATTFVRCAAGVMSR